MTSQKEAVEKDIEKEAKKAKSAEKKAKEATAAAEAALGALFGDFAQAAWPVGCRGWWPQPLAAQASAASARWEVTTCAECSELEALRGELTTFLGTEGVGILTQLNHVVHQMMKEPLTALLIVK